MPESNTIPNLRKQIKSSQPTERQQAVNALSEFKETNIAGVAANIILEVIEDNDQLVRQATWNALAQLGDAGIKALVGMIFCHDWDSDYLAWRKATEILISFGRNSVERLLEVLENGDNCAKSSAATILAEIGDTRAIEPLSNKLTDSNISFIDVVTALAKLKRISILEQLKELSRFEEASVREKAVIAIKRFQATETNQPEIRINNPNNYDKLLF